ncbi:MAG: hypothetical protein ACI9XB_003347, partial [Gammaproteobacteria bacterium]
NDFLKELGQAPTSVKTRAASKNGKAKSSVAKKIVPNGKVKKPSNGKVKKE